MIDVNDDNPVGPCPEGLDPGQCNTDGLEFRLDDPPPLLLIVADYAYNKNAGLPGTIKLGGWNDFGMLRLSSEALSPSRPSAHLR
jgi:porin